jgi:hypothetical protein
MLWANANSGAKAHAATRLFTAMAIVFLLDLVTAIPRYPGVCWAGFVFSHYSLVADQKYQSNLQISGKLHSFAGLTDNKDGVKTTLS